MKAAIKKIIKKSARATLPAVKHLFSKQTHLDADTARKNLEHFHPAPTGTTTANNILRDPICDLQIIVPAYNVEQYLEKCMASILSQETKYTYKVLLVEDGSTDSTAAIADQYASCENVTVIHQANKGLSGARNTALREIFGRYIMFIDSDDELCPGAIDALLSAAFEQDCDIVEGSMFHLQGNTRSVAFSHPATKTIDSALGILHGFACGKVFKAKCFAHLIFPDGFWFEDSILSFLVYPVQNKVCVISAFAYIYRRNTTGITSTSIGNPKAVDTYWITEMLMEVRRDLKMENNQAILEQYLRQIILNQKRMAKLPEYIQESAFVLSAELLKQYFPQNLIEDNLHHQLIRILSDKDWGLYKLYCRF